MAIGAAALIAAIGGVFAWARLSTDRSMIARALTWMEADDGSRAVR